MPRYQAVSGLEQRLSCEFGTDIRMLFSRAECQAGVENNILRALLAKLNTAESAYEKN